MTKITRAYENRTNLNPYTVVSIKVQSKKVLVQVSYKTVKTKHYMIKDTGDIVINMSLMSSLRNYTKIAFVCLVNNKIFQSRCRIFNVTTLIYKIYATVL